MCKSDVLETSKRAHIKGSAFYFSLYGNYNEKNHFRHRSCAVIDLNVRALAQHAARVAKSCDERAQEKPVTAQERRRKSFFIYDHLKLQGLPRQRTFYKLHTV